MDRWEIYDVQRHGENEWAIVDDGAGEVEQLLEASLSLEQDLEHSRRHFGFARTGTPATAARSNSNRLSARPRAILTGAARTSSCP